MRKHSKVSQYWEALRNKTTNPNLRQSLSQKSASIVMKPSFLLLLTCLIVMVFFSYRN